MQEKQIWTHSLSTSVNLRSFGKINDNAVGVFISSVNHNRTICNSTNIWDLARKIQNEVKNDIPFTIPLLGLIKYVHLPDYLQFQNDKNPAGRDSTIEVGNLGFQPIELPDKYSDNSKVPWKLIGLNFTQQNHIGAGNCFIASIVTCADKLNISICSTQPAIESTWNSEILNNLLEILHIISNSDRKSTISDILETSKIKSK